MVPKLPKPPLPGKSAEVKPDQECTYDHVEPSLLPNIAPDAGERTVP